MIMNASTSNDLARQAVAVAINLTEADIHLQKIENMKK